MGGQLSGDKPGKPDWLGLLEARELLISMGDVFTSIPQSNGSPDSPVLFAAIIATVLDEVLARTSLHLPEKGGPNPPHTGGAFMDDTYLWSHDRQHLQRTLAELEVRLALRKLPSSTVKRKAGEASTLGEKTCRASRGVLKSLPWALPSPLWSRSRRSPQP